MQVYSSYFLKLKLVPLQNCRDCSKISSSIKAEKWFEGFWYMTEIHPSWWHLSTVSWHIRNHSTVTFEYNQSSNGFFLQLWKHPHCSRQLNLEVGLAFWESCRFSWLIDLTITEEKNFNPRMVVWQGSYVDTPGRKWDHPGIMSTVRQVIFLWIYKLDM